MRVREERGSKGSLSSKEGDSSRRRDLCGTHQDKNEETCREVNLKKREGEGERISWIPTFERSCHILTSDETGQN